MPHVRHDAVKGPAVNVGHAAVEGPAANITYAHIHITGPGLGNTEDNQTKCQIITFQT